MKFVINLAWREMRASWRRLLFFFICIAIGVGAAAAAVLPQLGGKPTQNSVGPAYLGAQKTGPARHGDDGR